MATVSHRPGRATPKGPALALLVLCLAAWATVAGAEPRPWRLGSNTLVEHPMVWRAFRPVVRFAGAGDSDRAVAYLRRGSAILRAADADLRLDPATEAFRDQALEDLEDFDFAGLYSLLPERRGRWRRWTFEGEPLEAGYRVRPLGSAAAEIGPAGPRRELGHSSGVLRMRHVAGEKSRYLVHFRGGVGFGDVTWASVSSGIQDMVGVVDEAWTDDTRMILDAAEAFLAKSQPSLGREDRRVLSRMWSSFPSIAEHMVRLGSIDDILAAEPVNGCSRVQLRSRYHPTRLAQAYPAVAAYLEGLEDLSKIHTRLLDGRGDLLAEVWVDTETLSVRLEAFVRRGRLVASRGGEPIPHIPPDYGRMNAVSDMRVVLRGMEVSLRNVRVGLALRQSTTGAFLQTRLADMPDITVSGAAFGFIPTGLVDWFIPGDIRGLAEAFYREMVDGNEGRGLAAYLRFERPEGTSGATVDASVGAQVLESPLIRFALRVLSDRYFPDEDEREDLRKLALAYRDAFDADLARFVRFGAPVVAASWRNQSQQGAEEGERATRP